MNYNTLSKERALTVSKDSKLMRCELILTDLCNFKCPYCQGLREDCRGTMDFNKAKNIIDEWAKDDLQSIRLSGGEPTIYKDIIKLVKYIKSKNINHIAMSTNGYADFELYKSLIENGVNDFSVSLDSRESTRGDKMSGGIIGSWGIVIENIKKMSKLAHVVLGVVVTEETVHDLKNMIEFCATLGVADIKMISATQYNALMIDALDIDESVYKRYPFLKYRIENISKGRNVRGIKETDSHRCYLVLDDIAIAGNYHFPCSMYMRENGNAIGKISENMREERYIWSKNHDCYKDDICCNNCLDIYVDYNNQCDKR